MTVVTCVGIAVLDVIFSLPELPSGPGKNHATDLVEVGGGVAANAAVAISRLGGTARLVGALGDDQMGSLIRADLEREGVDVGGVRTVSDMSSPLSAVAVDPAGERMIVNHTAPGLFEKAPMLTPVDVAGSDGILCDVRWPEAASAALHWAREEGVPSVVDYDVGNEPAGELIRLATHVVFSADALRGVARLDALAEALESVSQTTDALVAVTVGEKGTIWLDEEGIQHEPAFEVDVVDTTGAGDVYHGALALQLANGSSDIRQAVRFASAAAALTCASFGGRSGIPTAEQVKRLMASST